MRLIVLVLAIIFPLTGAEATDLGTTGLIDTPTARMQADGTLSASIASQKSVDIYAITYQATPWIEATFRYSIFRDDFEYYDRSYEIKTRLLEETDYFPQISVGLRDVVGTGIFGAEYIVGSKKFGPVDVSLGLGWGRLAGKSTLKNPLTEISDEYATRENDFGQGGEASTNIFFRGKYVGPFGGISYTKDRFKFMAEYNPDQYDWEVARGQTRPDSPISYGVEWAASRDVKLALSMQHEEEFGFKLVAAFNTKAKAPRYPEPLIVPTRDIPQEDLRDGIDKDSWYDVLLYDMERSGLILVSADYQPRSKNITLTISNRNYASWSDAVARSLLLADTYLPKNFETINLVLQEDNMRIVGIDTMRPSLMGDISPERFARQIDFTPASYAEAPLRRTDFVTKKLAFDVSLQNRLQFFDPDEPLRYQFYALIESRIGLPGGIDFALGYAQDLDNNFDTILRDSDSVLPRVRSDMKKYYQQGQSGVNHFYLEKIGSFDKQTHYRLFGGILEDMFSGVGGEVLYQPIDSRLAFGGSLLYAKQRDYDRDFGHLDYDTVSGFLSAYWATPFYNYDLGLHAGRYLARDWGGTVELRRSFNNGWSVGLWATLTDVPFETFGEGSFDKGMYFKVPFHAILGQNTRSFYESRLRPIQRDGGQRIEGFSGDLWYRLRGLRYDALDDSKERMQP